VDDPSDRPSPKKRIDDIDLPRKTVLNTNMTHWQKYADENTYYVLVDSKPEEVVDVDNPNKVFCTAYVDTASCILGVKNANLPWLKQYKDCKTLDESIQVIDKLTNEITNGNFHQLKVFTMSAKFSTIDRNGHEFLLGAEKEISGLVIEGNQVKYNKHKFNIHKAKMLIWYNFCLCNMATSLVDSTLKWHKRRGVFLIDRLGDSDKRVQKFMKAIMFETSLQELWKRCAENHEKKPDWIGFEFPAQHNVDGAVIPAQNSMQGSLVDWIVLAAYATHNGQENRDPEFQGKLIKLVEFLKEQGAINGIHITGDMRWA